MPIESYLAEIIAPLITKPDAVRIERSADDMGILVSITCDKDDMGVLIGKAGETAKAIRHLVRIAGVKQNARVSVKINEPDGSVYRPRKKTVDEMSDKELTGNQ